MVVATQIILKPTWSEQFTALVSTYVWLRMPLLSGAYGAGRLRGLRRDRSACVVHRLSEAKLDAQLASDWLRGTTTGRAPYPPINLFAQDDDFVAIIELPGGEQGQPASSGQENTIRIDGSHNKRRYD